MIIIFIRHQSSPCKHVLDGELYLNLNLNTYYPLTFWGLKEYRIK